MTQFPADRAGQPLAWPDPHHPDWYIDAWNGTYPSKRAALDQVRHWTATEAQRVLAHGESPIDEDEVNRRLEEARPQ